MNNPRFIDDESIQKDLQEVVIGLRDKEDLIKRIERHRLKNRSLSAAITNDNNNPRNILNRDQMLDCADAYVNNGIIRTAVDKTVWFILGERVRSVIEPNDELTEGQDDKEIRRIEDRIRRDTLKDSKGNPFRIKELRKDIIRFNKRVQLHDMLTKFLNNTFVFAQGYQQISTVTGQNKWEPLSLKPLTPLRVVDKKMDPNTYEFLGLWYNFGRKNKNKEFIDTTDLISGWHDDNNVFDNTYYSGTSPVWSALSASQTIETILDENLPEFVKAIAEGTGLLYSGSNKASVSEQIKSEMKHSTIFIHPFKDMHFEKIDLARDPNELMTVINGLAKYICQAVNLPLFLMFEDTANFATANQVMQVFKVSTLNRYRTWLKGILEKCWYDRILAAHLNIDIEDVIAQDIKIKPIFEDINFETRLEVLQGEQLAFNMGVHERIDVAKAIDDKDAENRIAQEDAKIEEDRQNSIDEQGVKPDVQRTAQGKVEVKDPQNVNEQGNQKNQK